MPRKPKPFSYNDLSKSDLQLLEHPPTEKTWVCPGKLSEETTCKMLNTKDACWVCGTKKPTKATFLWHDYIKLCEKVQVAPGTRWKKVSSITGLVFDKEKGKWIEKDLVR